MSVQSLTLHASAVALEGRAVLILGRSGAGKSSLALRLMALGAVLVGDDQVLLQRHDGTLSVSPAPNLAGMIEARGIGILNAQHVSQADVVLAVDLDATEIDRLPPERTKVFLDLAVPSVQKSEIPAFPEAILQYLKAGKAEI